MKSEIETLKQQLSEEKQKNTPLVAERLAVVEILLSRDCPCDEGEVCDCVQGRALAAMGICGFLRHGSCTMPKGHKGSHNHWHLIKRHSEAPSGGSDKALNCQPDGD